jgi:hypothetical protein
VKLFGSVARGETGNDVDPGREFDQASMSLIDLVGLEPPVGPARRQSTCPGRQPERGVRKNVEREKPLAF